MTYEQIKLTAIAFGKLGVTTEQAAAGMHAMSRAFRGERIKDGALTEIDRPFFEPSVVNACVRQPSFPWHRVWEVVEPILFVMMLGGLRWIGLIVIERG